MQLTGPEALARARAHPATRRFPAAADPRSRAGALFPAVRAPFRLAPGMRVFTIGSCFARNVEEALEGFDLPTRRFRVPRSEWPHRPNGLLNEYNPAAMAQRIGWALAGTDTRAFTATLAGPEAATEDLLLPVGAPVARARALDRRAEIDAVYAELPGSDALVLTLGLVECWEDRAAGLFLNRMPPPALIRAEPERYRFHRMNPAGCFRRLEPALAGLIGAGLGRILLTVSPVPLQTTFTGQDAVMANAYSKAALRVAAEELARRFPDAVAYVPTYETVSSAGLAAFGPDQVHVRPEMVRRVVAEMTGRFTAPAEAAPAAE